VFLKGKLSKEKQTEGQGTLFAVDGLFAHYPHFVVRHTNAKLNSTTS
jgi:hypothetical protein